MLTSIGRNFSRFENIFDAGYWIFLEIFLAAPLLGIDAKQSCDVPSVQKEKTTNLTCTFDVDVAVFKKTITVLHYTESSPSEPEIVLYSDLFQGKIHCLTRSGYTILGNVTNTLVVRIDRVSRNHIGKYECHVMPSTPGNVESCNLSLAEVVTDTPTTSKPKDDTVLLHLSGTSKNRESLHYVVPALIIVCSVLFLLLVGLTVAVVIFCRRTRQRLDGSKDGYKVNTVAHNDLKTKQEEALLA